MSFFIYKFLDADKKTIYVGRTTDMKRRMAEHFSKRGHLPKGCYDQVNSIEYLTLDSEVDMVIKEIYYINYFKPIFNIKDKKSSELSLKFDSVDNWKEYLGHKIETKERLKKEVDKLSTKLATVEHKLDFMERVALPSHKEQLKKLRLMHKEKYKYVDDFEGITFKEVRELVRTGKDDVYEAYVIVNGAKKYHYILYSQSDGLHFAEKVSGKFSETSYEETFAGNLFPWIILDFLSFRKISLEESA